MLLTNNRSTLLHPTPIHINIHPIIITIIVVIATKFKSDARPFDASVVVCVGGATVESAVIVEVVIESVVAAVIVIR